MHEGLAILIIFLIMFILMAAVFAGLYWWYYVRKHKKPNGGNNGGPTVKCDCPTFDRINYADQIPDWSKKTKSACEKGLTPKCIQTQKLVCEEGGGCFDHTSGGPWCYSCGPQKIVIPPTVDIPLPPFDIPIEVPLSCDCKDENKKKFNISGWEKELKEVCDIEMKPNNMSQCLEKMREVCLSNGGCWNPYESDGSTLKTKTPWCYTCDPGVVDCSNCGCGDICPQENMGEKAMPSCVPGQFENPCPDYWNVSCVARGGCPNAGATASDDWCYNCKTPRISGACDCDKSRRKVYRPGVTKGSVSHQRSYCYDKGGCFDAVPNQPWCYYCD